MPLPMSRAGFVFSNHIWLVVSKYILPRDSCFAVTLRNGAETAPSFRLMNLRSESDHGFDRDPDSEETSSLQNDFTWKPCVGKMMSTLG